MSEKSNVDENLLTAAKLREQIEGRLEGHAQPHGHTGIVADPTTRSTLSFLEAEFDLEDFELGRRMLAKFRTDAATEAVASGNGSVLSHLVGVTEQDLDASALTVTARILDVLESDTLTTLLAAGDPNSGKTNTVWLLTELAKVIWPDLLVVSNARASIVDEQVNNCHDLACVLIENRDTPKVVIVDEGSTHFDARSKSYAVATQWAPLLKRMSKLGVELVGVIGHTGKDVDPELKRLTSLGLYKPEPKVAGFYSRWPADSDRPADLMFSGDLVELEATGVDYDPDEPAGWDWNLREDLIGSDLDWDELGDRLDELGPAET